MKKFFLAFFSIFLLSGLIFVRTAKASEGTFELRSTNSNNYKCFAASLQMQNLTYLVSISCRNIVFPVEETIYSYILWANPADGGAAVKLGTINLGRAQFSVKPAFTSLFITGEQNPNVKGPTGTVLMKGSVKPIAFLEKETVPTIEENPDATPGEETPEPTPTPGTSVRARLLTGLKRAGLASGLALIAILGL